MPYQDNSRKFIKETFRAGAALTLLPFLLEAFTPLRKKNKIGIYSYRFERIKSFGTVCQAQRY